MALKSGGSAGVSRGQHRLRTGFVVTQVALALALLVISGLLLRMLEQLRDTQLGFQPDHLLTAEIDLPHGKYEGRNVLADFYQPLLERVGALPGVQAAGLIQMLPGSGAGWNWEHIHIYGTEPLKSPRTDPAEVRFVSPGYYKVFQDALVQGRLADPRIDKPTTRLVCVVNEAFVKKFIPIYQPPLPELDYMIGQIPGAESMNAIGSMHLVMRTSVDPNSLVAALRRSVAQVDATVALRQPETMNEVIADVLTFERLENWLFGAFAALAVLLAIVGLYGLISHEVELSTREIGIRLALGASRGAILQGIFRRVGWMMGMGVAIGLAVTFAAERLINSVVAVHPEQNAGLITALALGLALVGLLASALPARRASSLDPMDALREE
jgi:hypothetical protein